MNERLAVGGGGGLDYPTDHATWPASIADRWPARRIKDQALREKLADWYVQAEGLKYTRFRTMTALSRGQTPGPESSIGKIVAADQLMQDLANTAVELEDQFGIIDDPALAPLLGAVPGRR